MTNIEKQQSAILSNILNEQYPSTDSTFFCYSLFVYYLLGAVMAIVNHYTVLSNFYTYIYLFCGFVYTVTNIADLIRCARHGLREYIPDDKHTILQWSTNIIYTITVAVYLGFMSHDALTSFVALGMFALTLCNIYRIFMTMNPLELVDEKDRFYCMICVPTKFLSPYKLHTGYYVNGEFTPYKWAD